MPELSRVKDRKNEQRERYQEAFRIAALSIEMDGKMEATLSYAVLHFRFSIAKLLSIYDIRGTGDCN